MAARKKQAISEYLGVAPKKDEIVELIFDMQSCLLWGNGQRVSRQEVEEKLQNLASNASQLYFLFAVYPRWIYVDYMMGDAFYGDEEINPNLGPKVGAYFPFYNNEGDVNKRCLAYFKSSEKYLPPKDMFEKVIKSSIYKKWLIMAENAASIYINSRFGFIADAHAYKGAANIEAIDMDEVEVEGERDECLKAAESLGLVVEGTDDALRYIEEFYTCTKFILYQVYLAELYCYLTDLERGYDYVENYGSGHYHQQRKIQLAKTREAILEMEAQLKGDAFRCDLYLPYSKDHWSSFFDCHWIFQQEFDWYGLFGKIGDTYYETAFVFRMIGCLLDHGLSEDVAAKILQDLTMSLRGQMNYGKLIFDKIKIYIDWHKNQVMKHGVEEH